MDATLSALLVLTWGFPLLLALAWTSPWIRRTAIHLAPLGALPGLLLALLALLASGPSPAGEPLATLALPPLFTGLNLALDGTGQAFLLFTSILWLAGGLFARGYHATDPARSRFFLFFTLTLAGNLGLIVAGDLLGFYLFFALMTFAAYGLVVHAASGEALRAGTIYIAMAVLGELALLTGLFGLGHAFGGVPTFGADIEGSWIRLVDGTAGGLSPGWTGILLLIGFGVKAGLVPLHLWLPLAHPVAPTAASALLSGAMIKAGLLGWIRMLPAETALPDLSVVFLAGGAAAALYGVVVGTVQDDPKTILAYSSVSQMGYMAMGTGLVLADPALAPLAGAALVIYAVHHGLAKGALFLAVGIADRAPRLPGEGDRVRGWLLGISALPALALAGLPLTTGGLAKNALKDGIEELGGLTYQLLDPYLLVAALGTTLLMARFLVALDARRQEAEPDGMASVPASHGPWTLVAPWAGLVVLGALGHLWFPGALVLPAGTGMPRPGSGAIQGLLPVLVGAGLAWVVLKPNRIPTSLRDPWRRMTTLRIPAGDLLVPLETGLRRLPLPHQEVWVAALEARGRRVAAWCRLAARRLDRAAARDVDSINSPLLGLLLVLLAIGLLLALL